MEVLFKVGWLIAEPTRNDDNSNLQNCRHESREIEKFDDIADSTK